MEKNSDQAFKSIPVEATLMTSLQLEKGDQMKNRTFILGASYLTIALMSLMACKGKQGEKGPLGPGSSLTTYEGTYLSQPFTFSAPVLIEDSIVNVRVSSDTVNWDDSSFTLNFNNKTIVAYGAFSYSSGSYKALIQNPS